jgi:predicted transposase YdaD
MAGLWDSLMKRLVRRYARQFVRWLSAEAVFVRALDIELQNQQLFADALLEVMLHGTSALLHIEFQTYDDADMEVRLQEYNVLASRQYEHLPVYSYVIYLRKVGEVAVSPLVRGFPDGEEVHRFFFRVIELWEVAAEVLLQAGWPAVLPLVTLTKGGKRPEVVKEMIDRLASAEEYDLLAIAQVLGGLVFKTGPELAWFRKRFSMFQDILSESWVYQEIGQKYLEQGREQGLEQGVEKGREEERQQELQRQRQTIIGFVQRRFPEITALAEQLTAKITDPETLQTVILKLLDAQTVEEARQVLLNTDKSEETKH